MPTKTPTSFLDRPAARVLAVLCFLAAAAGLGYVHREDLFPGSVEEVAGDDPMSVCVRTRLAEVGQMEEEGLITAAQAETFRARIEGVCQAQTGTGAPAGPPPPLPQ